MKNSLKLLPLILGLAAVCCAKEEVVPGPEAGESQKMKVTLTSGETKTAMTAPTGESTTYTTKWTADDQLGVLVRSAGKNVDTNVATEALEADTSKATFTATVTSPKKDAIYEFYTYYPYSSIEGQDYKSVKVEIPSEQSPANDSFDPKADILSGYPIEREIEAGEKELSDLSLQFMRKTAVVRLLVPSCTGFDGIKGDKYVTEVKVTFDKNVVGVASWDLTDKADLALNDETSASGTVVLKYDKDTHKITDPIWMSIAPVSGVSTISFAFKVDDNTWLHATANFSTPVSFSAGVVKKFSIPISATSWDLKSYTVKYQKVTSEPADWRGQYLIVGENNDVLYACDQKETGDWGSCAVVYADSEGQIIGTEDTAGYEFNVVSGTADGTYAFVFQNGGYVSSGAKTKFNKEQTASAGNTDFKLTADGDYVKVESNTKAGRFLRYNYNGGKGGLRFYDGTTGVGVSLYKKVGNYSVIDPVIDDPQGIPDATSWKGVINATFSCGITKLGKNSVSVESVDGTVVTAASVSYESDTATVSYSVSENNCAAARKGSITLKAGDTEKTVEISQEEAWTRVTKESDITSGGTFILGYEASAESGVIVPMQNEGTATITTAGIMYSGTTSGDSGNGTIDMSSVTETSLYEVTISASTVVDGAVNIKIGDNYLGNTDTKNNCKLFASESATTAFTPTMGDNDAVCLKIDANTSYNTLQYYKTSGSERFAVYGGAQKNPVLYKKKN